MSQQWVYKATTKKISLTDTADLAIKDGFLCRSAFNATARNGVPGFAWVASVRYVHFGCLIHMYYLGDREPETIGTFEVVDSSHEFHQSRNRVGPIVEGSVLYPVTDSAFSGRLLSLAGDEGYQLDPKLRLVTGWLLVHRPDVTTPTYDREMFPGNHTLWRYPREQGGPEEPEDPGWTEK